MVTNRELGYFRKILHQVQVKKMEMISAPAPKMLMQASVKQALRRLDNVDPEVKAFFMGAAKTVAEGADPVGALASALGCLSGLTEVPKDRSLLTQVIPGGACGCGIMASGDVAWEDVVL